MDTRRGVETGPSGEADAKSNEDGSEDAIKLEALAR